ncbi:substrate-binding domain-containing protein [Roseibacillus ishigakijimensis]|uniref:substrate-binding domain-containing protein n=1 Tax=Roseibacillus ishigakijimensis TaxID=454146 RepID=UPI003627949F
MRAEFGQTSDATFASKVLSFRPDAIVCSNDHTAAILIQTLGKFGISVPQNVRVVGFDDTGFASLVTPPPSQPFINPVNG